MSDIELEKTFAQGGNVKGTVKNKNLENRVFAISLAFGPLIFIFQILTLFQALVPQYISSTTKTTFTTIQHSPSTLQVNMGLFGVALMFGLVLTFAIATNQDDASTWKVRGGILLGSAIITVLISFGGFAVGAIGAAIHNPVHPNITDWAQHNYNVADLQPPYSDSTGKAETGQFYELDQVGNRVTFQQQVSGNTTTVTYVSRDVLPTK